MKWDNIISPMIVILDILMGMIFFSCENKDRNVSKGKVTES